MRALLLCAALAACVAIGTVGGNGRAEDFNSWDPDWNASQDLERRPRAMPEEESAPPPHEFHKETEQKLRELDINNQGAP